MGPRMPRLLVLMDVNMPEMGGVETTKRIRKMLETKYNERAIDENLKVIAVSAQEKSSIAEAETFYSFLNKPLDANNLEELLTTLGF